MRCAVPSCDEEATVGLRDPGAICQRHLARKTTKPPQPHGLDSCTIQRAAQRCIHCGTPLAQALVDAEPDNDTHPACDSIDVWLHHQVTGAG